MVRALPRAGDRSTAGAGCGGVPRLAWLIVGGSADGPLSWRKPTMLGISFGLTAIALSWVSQFLALSDRALRATLGALVVSFSLEVAWVSAQHARGGGLALQRVDPAGRGLFLTAGAAVLVGVAVIAIYPVRSVTSSTAPQAMILALRAGLLVLLVSMGAGLWMILRGTAFALPPATVGAAGSIKLLHAIGMHPIEVLPALAQLARERYGRCPSACRSGCDPGRSPWSAYMPRSSAS